MARRKWDHDTIQRALNGDNVSIQSGYTGKKGQRKDGEEWTDSRGTWKKVNGVVLKVNKQMDAIRELVRPRCSVCNLDINLFGDKSDKKIFAKTGKCFTCLEIEEQTLKIQGKYEDYETAKMFKNKLSALKEFKQKVTEAIDFLKKDDCKLNMIMSSGEIVTWTGAQNAPLLKEAEEDLAKAEKEILDIEDAIAHLNH